MLTNDQLAKWDRESFIHPSTHLAQHARGEAATRIIKSAEGSIITDRDGNRLPRRLRRALLREYRLRPAGGGRGHRRSGARTGLLPRLCRPRHRGLDHAGEDGHGPRARSHVPRSISASAGRTPTRPTSSSSGTMNNILGRPEKKKIISRWRGYHGSGLMSGSLTGLSSCSTRSSTCRSTPCCTRPRPTISAARTPEPDGGGVHRPMRRRSRGADRGGGRRHHRRLHRGADAGHGRHRAPARGLLAGDRADPAQARHPADRRRGGDGLRPPRVHVRLAHYGITPDIMTIAKGLTSAYAPLSGSIVSEGVWTCWRAGRTRTARSAMAGPTPPIPSARRRGWRT
jgi:L-2,4-diaminobutyrate transaminase